MNIIFLKLVIVLVYSILQLFSCILSDASLLAAYDNEVKSVRSYRVFNSLRCSLNISYENSERKLHLNTN